jgi:DNA-binding SARP family transcriptional activator
MLRLHTLGRLDLQIDRAHPHPLVAQPKRLGLLMYLCTAPHAGFRRRDHLLSLFWPELDDVHARAALRQMLYVLRQRLGDAVIRQRGDDEIGVHPDAMWCDASAFETACHDGRSHDAIALYHGDFLDGVHIPGSSQELDEWMDRERRRLRELARTAMWAIAESAVLEKPATAVSLIRRAVSLAPDDEPALRRALALMEQLGDRAGALQLYHEFRARMAREYGAEPATITKTMAEALRFSDNPPVRNVESRVLESHIVTTLPAVNVMPARRTTPGHLTFVACGVVVVVAGLLLAHCAGS